MLNIRLEKKKLNVAVLVWLCTNKIVVVIIIFIMMSLNRIRVLHLANRIKKQSDLFRNRTLLRFKNILQQIKNNNRSSRSRTITGVGTYLDKCI